ncbi:hypothetical protein [Pseudonocardia sp. HH130630-07]|uniref:hypothetical protein n=1 Tax=Pseudonocardia sp. HH130630-07 TaxID=1690815 RepID=UPI0008153C0E|nr:hypothetical protein [Pseudonocardia sp. HH130630-07]ANY06630.1 hypothetical protein AFB00_10360 [Pseudonocardia sp. HH130630-07]
MTDVLIYGVWIFTGIFALTGMFYATLGCIYLWRAYTHPSRNRRALHRILTEGPRDLDADGHWTIDYQDFRYLLLDDLCTRAAAHGWQFVDQTIYEDRWHLRFRQVGGPTTIGTRSPAALHNHLFADPCTCTATDHHFSWDDPDRPVDHLVDPDY